MRSMNKPLKATSGSTVCVLLFVFLRILLVRVWFNRVEQFDP